MYADKSLNTLEIQFDSIYQLFSDRSLISPA
jgi:hypothetical protein